MALGAVAAAMSFFVLASWVTGLSQTSSPSKLIEGQPTGELESPESLENLGRGEFAEIPPLARSRASALLNQVATPFHGFTNADSH